MGKEIATIPKEKIKLKPVITVQALMEMKFSEVRLSDEMRLVLGDIEDSFFIFIFGPSAEGKTTLIGELLAEIHYLGLILYESFEEGARKTFQKMVKRTKLDEICKDTGLHILDGESFEHISYRLSRKRSAKIVVIDTWQYTGWKFEQYVELKKRFTGGKTINSRKIFIINSHCNDSGTKPDGATAERIRRDVDIKIKVSKYIAFVKSRFENVKNHVIWEEGAKAEWGKEYRDQIWKMKPVKKTKVKKGKEEIVPELPVSDQNVEPVIIEQ